MKIQLDVSELDAKLLKPVKKVVDACVLVLDRNTIECVATSPSRTVHIYSKITVDLDIDEPISLNVQDIGKLSNVISCVPDKSTNLEIVGKSHIKGNSKGFKFKFGLGKEGTVDRPLMSRDKLNNIQFTTTSNINAVNFKKLLTSTAMISDDDTKFYFSTDDSGLICQITNGLDAEADSLTLNISDSYDGDPITTPIVCDIDTMRKMGIQRDSTIQINFNQKVGFLIVDIMSTNSRIRYAVPGIKERPIRH